MSCLRNVETRFREEKGVRHLAFISQALIPRHLGLSTYEKELIAQLHVVDKWRLYLQPNHFIIKINHFSRKFLKDQRITTCIILLAYFIAGCRETNC